MQNRLAELNEGSENEIPDLVLSQNSMRGFQWQLFSLFCLQRVEIVYLWRLLRVRFRRQGQFRGILVFRDLLKATHSFCLIVGKYISVIEGFTSAFGIVPRSQFSSCAKLSSSSVNYCHLLQALFCGIRSGNVIDGLEVGI